MMTKSNIIKENFLEIFNQLNYDYQNIVLSTFRCLATYEDILPLNYKPFDISRLITKRQKELNLSDVEVCNKVNEIIGKSNESQDKFLSVDTFFKIKSRNTQTSKKGTDFLKYISQNNSNILKSTTSLLNIPPE